MSTVGNGGGQTGGGGVTPTSTGWSDNIQSFVKGSAGAGAPALTTLANGARLYSFGNGDSVHVEFHTNHDLKPDSECFPHVHFACADALSVGETIEWEVIYNLTKGHSQGESVLNARTTLTLTYTATGSEIAGEHIVLESATGVALAEPDMVMLAEYKKTGGTYTGTVYGIMGDLHYQTDRDSTINKVPNFYGE